MPIAYLTLELRIEGAHSLKDKRQVLRSVKDRLRNSFNIAIAEIEVSDLWQRATLGVVSISDSRDYLDGLMRKVEREAMRLANNAGAEVVDSFMDFVESRSDEETRVIRCRRYPLKAGQELSGCNRINKANFLSLLLSSVFQRFWVPCPPGLGPHSGISLFLPRIISGILIGFSGGM